MKRLNVTINCVATYNSAIEVPDDMSLADAITYAREHISDIPLGTLEWVHDIDELDGELCSFDAKDSPAVKTVLPISLIRNRPSEGEQWADTLFLILRDGEFAGTRQEAEALLRMRIGDYLMTPEGWKSVKEASCDFNWGDLINLLPLPQYGILGHDALITAVSRRTPAVFRDSGDYATLLPYETISVDQDELLAPDNVDAKAYLYGPDDVLLAEVDASIDFQDGNILFEHSDVWAVIDHTTRGKVVLNGNEFELDANEMLQRLA